MYEPRLTKPEKGNKYYIRRVNGGYSTAILGSPMDNDCNVLANCVGYAIGRYHEISKRSEFDYIDSVNAENLFDNAKQHGLKTGNKPALGSLIVWAKGKSGCSADGAGHVAVVEKISKDGTITTTESEYNGRSFVVRTYKPPYIYGSLYTLLGFVYQKDKPENPYPVPVSTIKKGNTGINVKWLQWELFACGYLRENEIDGDFGKITLGALLAFQFENNLQVDGVCGKNTRRKLVNF